MKLSHTPGPWQAADETAGQAIRIRTVGTIDSALTLALVLVPFAGTEAEQRANARLIAAAPDLLAALLWIVDHGDTGEGGRPAYHAMRNHSRAAIAKATGEGAA